MINGAYSQNSGAGRRMLEQTTWTFPQEDWLKGDTRTWLPKDSECCVRWGCAVWDV